MKKRNRFLLVLLIIFLFTNPVLCCRAEESATLKEEDFHATSVLFMDGNSGRVLYEKNGYEVLPMASTTKIMTCLYALEHGNPDQIVTVSEKAAQAPQVKLGMKKGQTFYLSDLLYSLMLESHNDTAVAIAEAVEGNVDTFCKKMTEEARSFGCEKTTFETPNGLDSENHHTTAYELGLITKKALSNSDFRKIIQTSSYSFSSSDGKNQYSLTNHDAFLSQYEGAIGVKTGFTSKAGYCFVGAVESEDRLFISVVLACGWPPHKTWKWEDTKKLMDYGTEHYKNQILLCPGDYSLPILPVTNGQNKTVDLFFQDSVSFLVKDDEAIQVKENLPKSLSAPIKANEAVGSLDVYLNDQLLASVPVYTKSSSKRITFRYCLDYLLDLFFHFSVYEGL